MKKQSHLRLVKPLNSATRHGEIDPDVRVADAGESPEFNVTWSASDLSTMTAQYTSDLIELASIWCVAHGDRL